MHAHPDLLTLIARGHAADLLERAEDERSAARAQLEQAAPEQVGESYRLPDGSWLHLRHDSS